MSMTLHEMAQWRKRLRIGDYAKLHCGDYGMVTNIYVRKDDVVFSVRYISKHDGNLRELNRISIWYFSEPMSDIEVIEAKLRGLL